MVLRVQYQNFNYDYVSAAALNKLIASKSIIKFLRPSEDEWVDIERGPLRGSGEKTYSGPERRQAHTFA